MAPLSVDQDDGQRELVALVDAFADFVAFDGDVLLTSGAALDLDVAAERPGLSSFRSGLISRFMSSGRVLTMVSRTSLRAGLALHPGFVQYPGTKPLNMQWKWAAADRRNMSNINGNGRISRYLVCRNACNKSIKLPW